MEINENFSPKAKRDFYLVIKARDEGDQKAFADLMGFYRDTIYFMMLKMVNDSDDAEDLTIEAFGKAFNRLSQYTPNFAFSTWLFKIASNNCIDFIRKKRLQTLSIDQPFEDDEGGEITFNLEAHTLDPEEKFIKKQKIEMMRVIVERLKPRYKNLIILRYFKEYSYEEISKEMDLPLGTVKAQLFRAREFLYQIIKHSKGNI